MYLRKFALSVLTMSVLMLSTHIAEGVDPGMNIDRTGPMFSSSTNLSLNGELNIEDIAGTRIIGDRIDPPGGYLGFYGELSKDPDDNINIRIAARDDTIWPSTVPDWKRLYTFETNGERFPKEIIIDDETEYSYVDIFENSAPISMMGDIDGNGIGDMVTTWEAYPHLYDPHRTGYMRILFDFENGTTKEVIVNGSDERDNFGKGLAISDVDGDGKDDIFVGAPGGDGTMNARPGCGEIYVFRGKDNATFPTTSHADILSDHRIEGAFMETENPIEYAGDRIGKSFEIVDMDGDGTKEIAISNHLGSRVDENSLTSEFPGWVAIYDILPMIPIKNSIKVLSLPSDRATIYGNDPGDSFGWIMDSNDIDNDGFTDLFFTAPHADGKDNSVPNCGEAFIIYGCGIRVQDITISGPGVDGKDIFCQGGVSNWSFEFTRASEILSIGSIELHLDPGGEDIVILVNDSGSHLLKGSEDWLVISNGYFDPNMGRASLDIDLQWSFPCKGSVDVAVILTGTKNERISDIIPGLFYLRKDLVLNDHLKILSNGDTLETTGGCAVPGSLITFEGLEVAYEANRQRSPLPGVVDLILVSGSNVWDRGPLSEEIPLQMKADDVKDDRIEISLEVPGLGPWRVFHPDMGDPLGVAVPTDEEPPEPPKNIRMNIDPLKIDEDIRYRTQLDWEGRIGLWGDSNGSGLRHYEVTFPQFFQGPVIQSGGLFTTCFTDLNFRQEVLTYVEEDFDLNWGPWGPDPNYMPPTGYSVRWHGWIIQDEPGEVRFSTEGLGELKLILDGECLIDWSDLRDKPDSVPFQIRGGVPVPIEIYYRIGNGESRLKIMFSDVNGKWTILGGDPIHHPSMDAQFTSGLTEEVFVRIISVDWVGHRSIPVEAADLIDRTPPIFDIKNHEIWTSEKSVKVRGKITDPEFTSDPISGIDTGSLEYRITDRSIPDNSTPAWTNKGLWVGDQQDGSQDEVQFSLELERQEDWNGVIHFRVSDLMLNSVTSNPVMVGFDHTPPNVELFTTADGPYSSKEPIQFFIMTDDGPGSGLDEGSFEIQNTGPDGQWSGWTPLVVNKDADSLEFRFDLYKDPGSYLVQVRCSDRLGSVGTSNELAITVKEEKVNQPPKPMIKTPLNNSHFERDDTIELDAVGTWDDGLGPFDPLQLTWVSNISGIIATGGKALIKLGSGYHLIELFADDGEYNISTQIRIQVGINEEPVDTSFNDEDPDTNEYSADLFLYVILISITLIIVGFLVFIMVKMKVKDDEVRLDVVKKTDDDELYDRIAHDHDR